MEGHLCAMPADLSVHRSHRMSWGSAGPIIWLIYGSTSSWFLFLFCLIDTHVIWMRGGTFVRFVVDGGYRLPCRVFLSAHLPLYLSPSQLARPHAPLVSLLNMTFSAYKKNLLSKRYMMVYFQSGFRETGTSLRPFVIAYGDLQAADSRNFPGVNIE